MSKWGTLGYVYSLDSEIGMLTSLDAPELHASSDVIVPISRTVPSCM